MQTATTRHAEHPDQTSTSRNVEYPESIQVPKDHLGQSKRILGWNPDSRISCQEKIATVNPRKYPEGRYPSIKYPDGIIWIIIFVHILIVLIITSIISTWGGSNTYMNPVTLPTPNVNIVACHAHPSLVKQVRVSSLPRAKAVLWRPRLAGTRQYISCELYFYLRSGKCQK